MDVLYREKGDGEVHAMALQDAEAWNEFGVKADLVLPVAGLPLVAIPAVPSAAERVRSRRS